MTTEPFPANARTAPDDKARHKGIASIVFHMEDELGQTERLIKGAMLSLEAVTMRPLKKLTSSEVENLIDAVSTVMEAALDRHGAAYDMWRDLFTMTRKDAGNV